MAHDSLQSAGSAPADHLAPPCLATCTRADPSGESYPLADYGYMTREQLQASIVRSSLRAHIPLIEEIIATRIGSTSLGQLFAPKKPFNAILGRMESLSYSSWNVVHGAMRKILESGVLNTTKEPLRHDALKVLLDYETPPSIKAAGPDACPVCHLGWPETEDSLFRPYCGCGQCKLSKEIGRVAPMVMAPALGIFIKMECFAGWTVNCKTTRSVPVLGHGNVPLQGFLEMSIPTTGDGRTPLVYASSQDAISCNGCGEYLHSSCSRVHPLSELDATASFLCQVCSLKS